MSNCRTQISAGRRNGREAPCHKVKKVDGLEVVLNGLTVRTNGGKKKNWEAPARYWEPAWEFRRDGKAVGGWSEPEWVAEDPLGNRGQFLGIHQSVLRFIATVYPEATNTLAAETVASLPPIDLGQLSTNIWWNKTCQAGSNSVVILGVCPPGVHVFSGGEYDTNSLKDSQGLYWAATPESQGAPQGIHPFLLRLLRR